MKEKERERRETEKMLRVRERGRYGRTKQGEDEREIKTKELNNFPPG